jgi:hypothetical protein
MPERVPTLGGVPVTGVLMASPSTGGGHDRRGTLTADRRRQQQLGELLSSGETVEFHGPVLYGHSGTTERVPVLITNIEVTGAVAIVMTVEGAGPPTYSAPSR